MWGALRLAFGTAAVRLRISGRRFLFRRRLVFLDEDVRVDAAEAERADCGTAG
jgi:hypothetical protein